MSDRIRKPAPFISKNIGARTVIDFQGRRRVTFWDRGQERWLDAGCSIPTCKELESFAVWMKKARAWARQTNINKKQQQ